MSTDDSSRIRKSTLPLMSGGSGAIAAETERPRRSTLETFNDELAVLERPLEGDVEYVDEPRKSRLRPIGFAAVMVVVGVGGALFMSRHRAAEQAETKVVAAATPAPALAAAPPVVLAAQTPAAAPVAAPVPTEAAAPEAAAPAAAEPEGDDAEADDAAASQDSAPRLRASKDAWSKVRSKPAHAKPARATSGKSTTTRRTTNSERRL